MKVRNLARKNEKLKARLAEAEELLAAIKTGSVDAFVTNDQKVFTLQSADYPYRVLVETINEGAVTLTKDGTMMYCNSRLAEMLCLPMEKIIGHSFFDFVGKEELPMLESILCRGKNETARVEVQIKQNNETFFPALVSCNSFKLDEAGLCMVITDLTEQKNTVHELKRMQKELEDAKRLSDIGVLAATVAHELRSPLAAIGMATRNIKKNIKMADISRHLFTIERKVAESDQIINNLLFYSHLKTPHYEIVNIYDVIAECIKVAENQKKSGASVIKDLNPVKDILIEADPIQIKEVFNNLLNNALDVLPSQKGRIKIKAENEDGFIKVVVEDNGPGIDRDILGKIFDPFFTTKAKGTGLGLSVCKQIVSMHSGEISVKSESGHGTSIVVRLPKTMKMKKRTNKIINNRILIIDDDADFSMELAEALTAEGYKVDFTQDAAEGEKLIRDGNYVAILLDYKMPLLTGGEILRRLKADHIRKRIFIVSGRPLVRQMLEEENVSDMASAIIAKPIDFDVLIKAIEQSSGSPLPSKTHHQVA